MADLGAIGIQLFGAPMERGSVVTPLPWPNVGRSTVPAWALGDGYIEGVLRVNGVPAARQIEVCIRDTLQRVSVIWSAPDGTYRIDGLNPDVEFDLRAQDWARARRDATLSAVKPKPYPP